MKLWTDSGATLDAAGRVRAFAGEAPSAARLTPLLGSAAFAVTGADRLEFIHGQVSSEVKRLPPGGLSEGLMLSHKGHALAQLRALRRSGDLLLVVDGGAAGLVERQLRAHIVFDQVELRGLPLTLLTLQGEGALEVLARAGLPLPSDGAWLRGEVAGTPVTLHPARRSGAGGCDLLVPSEAVEPVFGALLAAGSSAAGEDALDLERVLAGIPTAEREGGEGVLPQEAGLEHLVNYRKGCYLGQEIMARIEARGKLRRSLQGLKLEALPQDGARDILSGGKVVGRLGTLAQDPETGVLALAVLRGDIEGPLEVGGVRAEVRPAPA